MSEHGSSFPLHEPTIQPRVSIVLPTFNAAGFLQAAIERLLEQSLPELEIVVVDDGSTDATALVGAGLASSYPRVRYFRLEPNGGVAAARAFGARKSHGEFIWFVDADDTAPPRAVERMLAAAQTTGADTVIGSAEVHSRKGIKMLASPHFPFPVSGTTAFNALLTGQITGHLWNKLFRRAVVERIDFTPAEVHSDLAMTGQLLIESRTVATVSDVVYHYRLQSGSILSSGRRRDRSLRLLEDAFVGAAHLAKPSVIASREFRYFVARYVVLSGIKDAVLYPYESGERRRILQQLRRRLTVRAIGVILSQRDWRRLLLAVSAKLSVPLYRRLLKIADGS
ncbi:MAG: glycosyltransferase family 2 protein [Microbacteriaceae bacterium]|nr:glycosyltransferase family 2 protein [Microbacteriaceae bacterium]